MEREEKIVELLNKLFSETVIHMDSINERYCLTSSEVEPILKLEKDYPELVLGLHDDNYTISSFSLISTITNILVGKPLSFIIDENGIIKGVKFLGE